MGFPYSSVGKEIACNAGATVWFLGWEDSPGEGVGYPFQYSWASLVAQLVKNLPAMGRPGFDLWFGKILWRRERLPTPSILTWKFHGLYSPWGCKELDTIEWLWLHSHTIIFTFAKCTPEYFVCTFIELSNHHHSLISEHFYHPSEKAFQTIITPHSPFPLAPSNL